MKKIIFKNGLTFALLLLAGAMYGQTGTNIIRLTSLSNGSEADGTSFDISTINIGAAGLVTVTDDDDARVDYASGTVSASPTPPTNGTITLANAFSTSFKMQLNTGSAFNQSPGVGFGAITTSSGIDRSGDAVNPYIGDIGVRLGLSGGVDIGEGVTFGFDLTGVPSTLVLQITKITYSTFVGGANEGATIVNRQDTSKSIAFTGSTTVRDVTSLGMFLTGGTGYTEMLSTFNTSPVSPQNWRVAAIEFRLIERTTWNGTTWSAGTPTLEREAVIEGIYNAEPTGSFSCAKLTVNSGSITIGTDAVSKAVRSFYEITNNAGPTGIVVASGSFLRQDNPSSVNVGAITVNRNSNPLKRLDYTMWSSPVSGTQTLAAFSPLTSQAPNRFYTYNGVTNLYNNVDPVTTSFDATNRGKGFLIRMPNEDPTPNYGTITEPNTLAYPGVFVGVPNNGTITLSGLTADTFYSVGNPYPNTLSATLFLSGNSTGGTLYFWRKTNGVSNAPTTVTETGTSYATRTSVAGVASGTSAPNNIVPGLEIAVGQGFIVKTGLAATSLTFTNTMRAATAGTPFLKTKSEATLDRVWLNLTNATGAFSQMAIAYLDTATLGFDNGIDGEYINDSSLALTSNINNKEYIIQGRPTFDASDVVALNFKTAIAGDYTIAIDHFDGLFATGQDIYLADSKTGAETDLKAGPYNFNAAVGVDNSRFTLKYQKTLKVIDAEFNDNSVTVYAKNGTLYVNSGASAISNIKVFDVQGRLVSEQRNVKSNTATISNLGLKQALIVQVSSEDNKVVNKKVVN